MRRSLACERVWSKAREGAKAMNLAFVLLDFQHAGVTHTHTHTNTQTHKHTHARTLTHTHTHTHTHNRHEEMSLFRWDVISSFGENQRRSSVKFTFLASICNTKSSGLVKNLCGVVYVNCQKEKSPGKCSGSEHGTVPHRNMYPCTQVLNREKLGECFPILLT